MVAVVVEVVVVDVVVVGDGGNVPKSIGNLKKDYHIHRSNPRI